MSVTIQVSDEVFLKAKEIAEAGSISVGEVFEAALVDQVALSERFNRRAAKGSREEFLAVLDKVPAVEPEDFDRLGN